MEAEGPSFAAIRAPGAGPRRGPGEGRDPSPRAHAEGREGRPVAGAERDPRELQPHLHDVPRRRGPVHGRRTRRDAGDARPPLHRRRRGRHRLWRVSAGPAVTAFVDLLGAHEGLHRRRPPPLRDRAALPRREGTGRSVDPRLLHAHGGPGARDPALPPHPVRRGRLWRRPVPPSPASSCSTDAPDVASAARAVARSTMPYAFALAWPEGGALVAESLPEAEDLFARRHAAEPAGPRHLLPAPGRPAAVCSAFPTTP